MGEILTVEVQIYKVTSASYSSIIYYSLNRITADNSVAEVVRRDIR